MTASDFIRSVLAGLAISAMFAAVFFAVRPAPPAPVWVFVPSAFSPAAVPSASPTCPAAIPGLTECGRTAR